LWMSLYLYAWSNKYTPMRIRQESGSVKRRKTALNVYKRLCPGQLKLRKSCMYISLAKDFYIAMTFASLKHTVHVDKLVWHSGDYSHFV